MTGLQSALYRLSLPVRHAVGFGRPSEEGDYRNVLTAGVGSTARPAETAEAVDIRTANAVVAGIRA